MTGTDRSLRRRRGEPLHAAWDPGPREDPSGESVPPGGSGPGGPRRPAPPSRRRPPGRPDYARRRAVAALAVVLVVLTGLVVWRFGADAEEVAAAPPTPAEDRTPVVSEAPLGRYAGVDVPSAELPPGGTFPLTGAGTWHVVPGTTPQVGQGRVYTYSVEVEDGITVTEGDDAFATAVDATLDDPRSWVGSGRIAVRRVDGAELARGVVPDFRFSLTSQMTTRGVCGYSIRYEASCWEPGIGRVTINASRWVRGAVAFEGQLGLYRQYAINHEVGHVFDVQHVPCPVNGALAPVMMQQSFGTSNDYLAALTDGNPQGLTIPRDGKTCRANPWPY